ncbi:MAG TPA: EamA/RhaT family transporter [Opitutaceae bacterium]|nr:EamA/RhaT family transporter [Opitutaceae bacterium]
MDFPLHLLIPLLCAFVYVIGALTMKRAAELGVGVWRTSFVANWVLFLVFLPLWWVLGGKAQPVSAYWQPAVSALLFLAGQAFTFMAITRGDVSVTTPVMGSKVILVALGTSLLRVGDVPLKWWIGAALSASAVALLHAGEPHGSRRNVGFTVLLAALSAAAYSLSDVLIQKWVPAWGVGSYLPPMFLLLALYSFALMPFFQAPLRQIPARAWRWVGLGAALLGVNNAGIVLTLGVWGDATAVNIVYSARGLLSVVLVWAIGHWFASGEQHLAPRARRFRLAGAALMVAAIVLVLV